MLSSDDLQIRIIKELASPSSFRWNIRESYASMAENIGVDEETVRRGVKRARESGFLKGWRLMLNPHLVGQESAGVVLDVDDEERKSAVISQIKLLKGVVIIADFHGTGLRVGLNYESERDLATQVKLVSRICGRGPAEVAVLKADFPPSDLKMSNTDWQIIKALQKDPRRRPSEVAEEVGVSIRTVKRRLTNMTEGMAFYLLPLVNYEHQLGVDAGFLIFCPSPEKKRALDRQVPTHLKRIAIAFTEGEGFSIFSAVFINLAEAEEAQRWIRGIDGVTKVRMDIMRENIIFNGWLDEQIEKRLSVTRR